MRKTELSWFFCLYTKREQRAKMVINLFCGQRQKRAFDWCYSDGTPMCTFGDWSICAYDQGYTFVGEN